MRRVAGCVAACVACFACTNEAPPAARSLVLLKPAAADSLTHVLAPKQKELVALWNRRDLARLASFIDPIFRYDNRARAAVRDRSGSQVVTGGGEPGYFALFGGKLRPAPVALRKEIKVTAFGYGVAIVTVYDESVDRKHPRPLRTTWHRVGKEWRVVYMDAGFFEAAPDSMAPAPTFTTDRIMRVR